MTNKKSEAKASLKQKGAKVTGEFIRQALALWRLVSTIAQAMAAYILIPQDNLAFKVVGVVLLVNAAHTAVVNFTRN